MKKIFFVLIILLLGCREFDDNFPQVDVNINLYLDNPSNINLQAIGNYIYLNGGVGGILVYRKSLDEFIAYDRASPYNPDIRLC